MLWIVISVIGILGKRGWYVMYWVIFVVGIIGKILDRVNFVELVWVLEY